MNDAKERVKQEMYDLEDRITKLKRFRNDGFQGIDSEQKTLLNTQLDHMEAYHKILQLRLKIWK